MAYRRPGIKVTQEFADLAPALAPFNLPNCIVGPAYQVVSGDELGAYDGSAITVSYASLNAGNIVDTAELNENELADHQYPVAVTLQDAKIEQIEERETGFGENAELVEFSDETTNAFGEVVAGDEIEIFEKTIEIVSAKTNGSASAGSADTLVGASATEYENVKVGDTVEISGGTDVTTGTYTVSEKTDDQTLVLNSNFYTGGTSASDVAYRIDRTTGTNNQGVYLIREIVDANTIKLSSPLSEAESPLAYRVLREVDEIELERTSNFDVEDTSIEIFAALQLDGKDIVEGAIFADYRALRTDLASSVKEYRTLSDLQAEFGVDQIVPANPLAFGLALALQNTVTAVNGLGLNNLFFSNETLSYQAALDVLKKTEMYALCPLSQSPVIHQIFSTHVTQMSLPTQGLERVAIVNRKIIEEETVQDSSTTSGERIIINTQTAGVVALGSSTLSFDTDLFGDVQPGDIVEIVGGTGVTAGEYEVDSVDSATQLTLGDGFSATYAGSDVQFFVKRPDGLEANGQIFYDSNAQFLSDGVAVGHNLIIEAGNFEGSYTIVSVDSNNQVTLEQVPGVVSVQGTITYRVDKDLTNTEIAEFLAGYASAFGNRRLVITFPDVVRIPEGAIIRELPGFYLGCAIAALTTGLPTQQGFTNLTVSGFLGFVNGSDKFEEEQLDSIADGGVMIFDQEVPEAPLFVRHQLTTDRSAIKFQEYSVTKNVDFTAKFMRNAFKDYIGVYNIVDETLDELKGTAQSVITFLRDETVQPAIGGVIRSGNLVSIAEGTNIDTVAMRFRLDIPIPLNNIDITIQV
jgi:hypothetical protein